MDQMDHVIPTPKTGRQHPMTIRYHAAIATTADGEATLAVAHCGEDGGARLDEARTVQIEGGEAGITALYEGLRAQGIVIADHRSPCLVGRGEDTRQRAITAALVAARSAAVREARKAPLDPAPGS